MLYMFPLFVVVGGPFFPLASLFYWLANNSWTFGQLRVAHTMQDRRAAAKAQVVEEVKDLSKFSTPKPGAKPKSPSGRPVVEPSKIVDSNGSGSPGTGGNGSASGGPNLTKNGASGSTPKAKPTGSKPAPGARPQRTQPKKKNSGQR
jgi:YidC/Oxa1 family membrane protein insertase